MTGQSRGNRRSSFPKPSTVEQAQANGNSPDDVDKKKSDPGFSPEFLARMQGFLRETSFTIRGTTFTIGKIPALQGWQLLSRLINALALTLDIQTLFKEQGKMDQVKLAALLFVEVIKVPPESQEDALYELLPYIHVTSATIQMARPVIPQGVQGDAVINFVEQAFDGLEAIDLYELLIRGLVINFTPSSQRLADVFRWFIGMRSTPTKPKDSIPSSPSP